MGSLAGRRRLPLGAERGDGSIGFGNPARSDVAIAASAGIEIDAPFGPIKTENPHGLPPASVIRLSSTTIRLPSTAIHLTKRTLRTGEPVQLFPLSFV